MVSNMEWTNDLCLQLIKHYKDHRCLWDPTSKEYKNLTRKRDAWTAIGNIMNREADELRKKMESILASYRRERNKTLQIKPYSRFNTGKYKSRWFAYTSMQFLMKNYRPRPNANNSHSTPKNSVEPAVTLTVEDEHETQDTTNSDDDKLTQTISPLPPRQKEFESSKREKERGKRKFSDLPRVDGAYSILNESISNHNARDESTVFGEHVAMKHRKYCAYTKSTVEHLILNILYEADMGKYQEPVAPPSPLYLEPCV